jgi:hypothetical protein
MIDNIVLGISWIAAIVYLISQGIHSRISPIVIFIVTFGILYYVPNNLPLEAQIFAAVGVSYFSTLTEKNSSGSIEKFTNVNDDGAAADDHATKVADGGAAADLADNPTDNDSADDDDDDDNEDVIDIGKTIMDTYRSLTPDQVENMTSDTKELMKTQQQLLNTVKDLAPVIGQGKAMLDTFKDYFGGSKEMMQSLKDSGLIGSKKKNKP